MADIEVENLVKVYERGAVRAVDGISLTVEAREIFGFLGPNGAGKTTAVKIMTTLLRPTSGRVSVAGHDVAHAPAAVRAAIGVALQEVGLDDLQTGREFLSLQARLYGIEDARRRADELLRLVGLDEAAGRRIGEYSGGMRRRLDLAAGLVHRPRVLFLDEPTTGLDPASRKSVWEEVRRLNAAGTTIFLTTQYLEEADVLADRLAIIDGGRIVAEGTPDELKSSVAEDIVEVVVARDRRDDAHRVLEGIVGVERVGTDNGTLGAHVRNGAAALPVIVRELDRGGIEIAELSLRRPSLDDVFLRATGHRLEGATGQPADVGRVADTQAGGSRS